MLAKTDNAAHVGMHVFERAGLGKAPFAVVGYGKLENPSCPECPGGSCDFCGTGIIYACFIRSRDGQQFKIGCDCVAKTGDAGLIRAYKNRPEVRAAKRETAKRADDRVVAAWAAIMADADACAKLTAIQVDRADWQGGGQEPWLLVAKRVWPMCGAAGRKRYLKTAKRILEERAE